MSDDDWGESGKAYIRKIVIDDSLFINRCR